MKLIYWFNNLCTIRSWLVSLIIRRTLSPTKRKKLDWVTAICTLTGTGFPLNPSIKVKTSCPPSSSGKGNELRTAKLIEIKAANNNIPVPPCSESWAPISTIFTGPLNCCAVEEKFVI